MLCLHFKETMNNMSVVNKDLLVWSNSNDRWADASKKTKYALRLYDMPSTNTQI